MRTHACTHHRNCDSGTQQELTWVTLRTLYILLEKPLEDALKSKNKDIQSLVQMQNKLNDMGATNLVRAVHHKRDSVTAKN
jgi:serine/threonine protein phosphatase PrpC